MNSPRNAQRKMSAPYIKTAASACLIMSAMIAGTVSFGFFMDPVTSDLGFDRSTFSLYFSLITIVGTVTLPACGKLIARFGDEEVRRHWGNLDGGNYGGALPLHDAADVLSRGMPHRPRLFRL